jgi:hypothetical protein
VRQGTHDTPPTVADVVRRAVEACYPAGSDGALDAFLRHYEDRDEPVSALEGREREFFEQAGALQGQGDEPGLTMAAAVATYLAFRRDAAGGGDADLLRHAVLAEFDGRPPEAVAGWLAAQGVEV